MNSFLLYLLTREIAPLLAGRRIAAVRRLEPLLVIELADRSQAPLYLTAFLSAPGPFLWLDASDPLPDLGDAIMRRVQDSRLEEPIQPPDDRILRLPLESPEGGDRELALYLYGSAGTVRIQAGATIVESLHADEAGTPVPHTFGRRLPFLGDAGERDLAEALKSVGTPSRAVRGMESELVAAFTAGKQPDVAALLTFRDGMLSGHLDFVLGSGGRLGAVVPLPARPPAGSGVPLPAPPPSGAFVTRPHRSVRDACSEVGRAMLAVAHESILSRAAAPLRRRLQARGRLLEKLQEEARAAADFQEDRAEADILAAYQSRVPSGATEVELPDLYEEGKMRRIELDPALSIREQVEKRYKRAGKLERGREAIARRIAEVAGEIAELEGVIAAAEPPADLGKSLRAIERSARRLRLGRRQKPAARAGEEKQFRRYDLGSAWFVLVGRNDRENDEITFRVARPDDIWLHAQQTPGSHVVLKCLGKPGNPPDSVLEMAASVAAHYSKARHSRLVPVIYTRRKYVRKFRGAKAGEVLCEREKTIFAEPRLPE